MPAAKWRKALKGLNIGDVVEVTARASFREERRANNFKLDRKIRIDTICPVMGMVVGAIYRYEGVITVHSGWDEPTEFKSTKAHLLIKVATSWAGKDIEVPPEHVRPMGDNWKLELPWLPYAMSEREKEQLAEVMKSEMKDWPRDDAGRWLKGGGL